MLKNLYMLCTPVITTNLILDEFGNIQEGSLPYYSEDEDDNNTPYFQLTLN